MNAIDGIIALADYVPIAALVFVRVSGIFIAAPILGGGQMPFQVKALLTLALTIALMPTLGDSLRPGLPGPLYPLVLLKELATGLAIGFCFGLFLEAIRFAGDVIGRTAGFAAAEFFNPDAGTMEGPLGSFFFLSAALMFFLMDGHLELIAALGRSFTMIPPGGLTLGPHFGEVVSVGLNRVYVIALTLALPIEGAILAITVAEGVIARAVPQINILHITFAVKIMTTMVLLVIAIPAVVAFIGVVLALAHDFMYAFIQAAG